jgi:glycosyltransferase involved in cell wall biosynthesis
MKLAFVYDRINKFGGAERILLSLHQTWPQAPLYTAVYQPATAPWAKDIDIRPSFLQHFPLAKNHHELYPWLTPLVFESFDLDEFEVVLSVTSAEAKAVITKPQTLHICYCLTPTRYLWSHADFYRLSPGLGFWSQPARWFFRLAQNPLRRLDMIAASRPDLFLAISKTVKDRIKKYYRRDSEVIYPPVDTKKFSRKTSTSFRLPFASYQLLVSRFTSYKNIDLAIRACNQLKQNLIIVGTGRQEKDLKHLAGPTIWFTGSITDKQLIYLYQHCQSLLMPQEEDLGLVAIEAQAAGRPVVAFQKGGAQETVKPGQTGILFSTQTVDSLSSAVKQSISWSWQSSRIKAHARQFDQRFFKKKIKKYVEEQWQNQQKNFP